MYGTRVVSNQSLKLEVIGDDVNLQPDPFGLVEAAIELVKLGFQVLPYCTEDWVFCRRLMDPGCEVLMPWAAHIGTGQGPRNARALRELRERAPQIPLIVDAGIGLPSHACQVMEWGFDGVLLNTAVSRALDPVRMASAFAKAINAGRSAFLAGPMIVQEIAAPSTPEIGRPFTLDASQSANSVRQESRVKVILRRRDGVSRTVVVKSGLLRYSQKIFVGSHVLHADEPGDSGGKYFGPNPCELLLAALGACTSITVRMYAERKQGPLKSVEVRLAHSKIHAEECATCDTEEGTLDRIEREIALFGDLSDEQQHRPLEIAERCPVHRTLVSEVQICTRLIDDHPPVPIADK